MEKNKIMSVSMAIIYFYNHFFSDYIMTTTTSRNDMPLNVSDYKYGQNFFSCFEHDDDEHYSGFKKKH